MDLCNGGMIWSCCVDRDKVDFVDPNLGAVKDARCGEVHTSQARDEYVINTKETINYIISLIGTEIFFFKLADTNLKIWFGSCSKY